MLRFVEIGSIGSGFIAVGAGHIKDDFWVAVFLGHGVESAEDEAIDLGNYGGATRGDAAFCEGDCGGRREFR